MVFSKNKTDYRDLPRLTREEKWELTLQQRYVELQVAQDIHDLPVAVTPDDLCSTFARTGSCL